LVILYMFRVYYLKAIIIAISARVAKPQATTTIRAASGQISAVVNFEIRISSTMNETSPLK